VLKTKKLAYLAHPLGPDGPQRDANREAASKIMADLQAKHQDRVFVASWITLSGQWSETPENRKLGLECDLALLEHCQEIWLAGPEISNGMRVELDHAMGLGLRVIDQTYTLERKTVSVSQPQVQAMVEGVLAGTGATVEYHETKDGLTVVAHKRHDGKAYEASIQVRPHDTTDWVMYMVQSLGRMVAAGPK
jgi:hypothetical protein